MQTHTQATHLKTGHDCPRFTHLPFYCRLTHISNPIIWLPVCCRLSMCDRLLVSAPVSVRLRVCVQPDFKASRSFHLPRRWIWSLEWAMQVCTSLCVCVFLGRLFSGSDSTVKKEGIESLAVAWPMNINGSFTVTVIVSDKGTKSH